MFKLIITEEQLQMIKDSIQFELDEINSRYESLGLTSYINYHEKTSSIEISSIRIANKSNRRRGLGSLLMNEIVELCDIYSLICVLTPDNRETPSTALIRFYKKFGFTFNKGRAKDFRFQHSMIRYPI